MYTGILMNVEETNRNGYSYTKESLTKVISEIHNNSDVTIKGEHHPHLKMDYDGSLSDYCSLHTDNVCVEFTKIWIEDDSVHVNFNCTGPKGELLQESLDNNEEIYFAMRTIGNTNNKVITLDRIISIDLVKYNPRNNVYEYKGAL